MSVHGSPSLISDRFFLDNLDVDGVDPGLFPDDFLDLRQFVRQQPVGLDDHARRPVTDHRDAFLESLRFDQRFDVCLGLDFGRDSADVVACLFLRDCFGGRTVDDRLEDRDRLVARLFSR